MNRKSKKRNEQEKKATFRDFEEGNALSNDFM